MSIAAYPSRPWPARLRLVTDDGPAWGRVYADLRGSIESGQLAIGASLPGVAVLRQRHGVGGATVQRALDELRAGGMISEARRGARPSVIASSPQDPMTDLRGRVAALEERVERLERGDA
jgi:DNA-binding GntR family transcriptional regulator